jgi:hypothetical protein
VSVRRIVPTLTSKKLEIYLSMAGAKQLVTLSFILVPAGGRTCRGVLEALYCVHRSARRGGLQAKRERRSGLQVPEVLTEPSANIVVKVESVQLSCLLSPTARGLPLLL